MITLGIETSCDETACALVHDGKVLSNIVSSSVHLHKPYGGVVPEIASRYHIEYINSVVRAAIKKAGKRLKEIDLIAVTYGPGLCGSLLTGIAYAKALSYALSRPLIGINHLIAHLYANFIEKNRSNSPTFPFIGLIISGGHTSIYLCKGISDFKILGRTQDDAVGETFDKVAKILNLGYPGGPIIEKMAKRFSGDELIEFPKAYLEKGSLDFSFSGIKTAVLYYVQNKRLTKKLISRVAYAFQESVFDVVCDKVILGCRKYTINTVMIGGGVAANKRLFQKMKNACKSHHIKLFVPDIRFCLDNGAMVAGLGETLHKTGKSLQSNITAEPDVESGLL